MEKTIAGKTVKVTEEGFMTDFSQWNWEIGEAIAKEANIELTPLHKDVITYLQNQYKNEVPLTIRKVGQSGIVDIKQFYALFPVGPLKTATKIAGIPKPASCI